MLSIDYITISIRPYLRKEYIVYHSISITLYLDYITI